jgi:hypothetical protein
MTDTSTSRLTEHERFIIDRARQVAPALRGGDVREQLAAQLLDGLADLAERLVRGPICPVCRDTGIIVSADPVDGSPYESACPERSHGNLDTGNVRDPKGDEAAHY